MIQFHLMVWNENWPCPTGFDKAIPALQLWPVVCYLVVILGISALNVNVGIIKSTSWSRKPASWSYCMFIHYFSFSQVLQAQVWIFTYHVFSWKKRKKPSLDEGEKHQGWSCPLAEMKSGRCQPCSRVRYTLQVLMVNMKWILLWRRAFDGKPDDFCIVLHRENLLTQSTTYHQVGLAQIVIDMLDVFLFSTLLLYLCRILMRFSFKHAWSLYCKW